MYDRKKLIVAIVAIFAVLLVIVGVVFLVSTKFGSDSDRKVPFVIKPLDRTSVKKDKAEIENQVYKQVVESLVKERDSDNPVEGVVREGSFDPETKDAPTDETISFILDVDEVRRSWLVIVNYSGGYIAPSGIRTDCLASEDRIYGEDIACVQWSMTEGPSEVSKKDPLFEAVPYNGPFYRVDALGESDGTVSVVVRIGMIYTEQDDRVVRHFESYRQSSIKWLKEKSESDLTAYEIEWRDSNGLSVQLKKKGEPV